MRQTLHKVIENYCIYFCCQGNAKIRDDCVMSICPLYPHRLPVVKVKRVLTEKEQLALKERLTLARAAKATKKVLTDLTLP